MERAEPQTTQNSASTDAAPPELDGAGNATPTTKFTNRGPIPPVATGSAGQPAPSASDRAYGAPAKPAIDGPGILRAMIMHGTATPAAIAKLVHEHPETRDAVFEAAKLELDLPADFVQQVQAAEADLPPVAPHAPDVSGKTGSPFASNAPAGKPAKNAADNVLAIPNYQDGKTPVTDPTKTVTGSTWEKDADGNPTGNRVLDPTQTTVPGAGGVTTTSSTTKTIATDLSATPATDANMLTDYRTKVTAALDEQIAGAKAQTNTIAWKQATEAAKDQQTKLVADLEAAKEKVKDAKSIADLDHIVAANSLLVIPPEATLSSKTKTTTTTDNAAGLFDGSNVAGMSTKTQTYKAADSPDGQNTLTTKSAGFGVGTKGVDASASWNRQTTDPTTGAVKTNDTVKASLSGGGTDPLQASVSGKDDKHEGSLTMKAGDGQGTVGVGYKQTNKDGTPAGNIGVQAGVTQGAKGTGVTAGIPDARIDGGTKTVSTGGYGAADGSISVLVTGDDTIGYTLTFTASSRIKIGGFVGKRQGDTPVETGNDWGASGGLSAGHNHVVTRTKKLTKDEAAALIPDLDKMASDRTPDGKKAFGADAAYAAYSRVFGGHLDDLLFGTGDIKAGKGESVSVADENTVGADAKGNASTGDSKGSRASADASGSYEHDFITGASESNDNGIVTRMIRTGDRTKRSLSVGAGFGNASGKGTLGDSQENTKTYIFQVPEGDTKLLDEVRAIKTAKQAEDFAKAHPNISGHATGDVNSTNVGIGASAGPVAANVATAKTLDQNVAATKHTDANGHEVKDLSGTMDGKQEGTADIQLGGVKLYQEKTTAEGKGTVDPNGQASLDITTTTQSSNAADALGTNKADLDAMKTKDKALLLATGGPMAYVKKLAERVGESDTIGAHFDHASFETVVALAGDHDRWMKAADTNRDEWATLGRALTHPDTPKEWKDQDDSPNHFAADQLARMKAFAVYMRDAGPHGTETVQRLRSQFGHGDLTALGATLSFPPSLQSKRPKYDELTKKVEHLQTAIQPYAEAGDEANGDAYLDQLDKDLEDMKSAIQSAPDHQDAAKAVQAAAGVGQMQEKVRIMKDRLHKAVAAHKDNKSKADVDAQLADQTPKSTQIQQQMNAITKADTDKPKVLTDDERKQVEDLHEQQTKALADQEKEQARTRLPTLKGACQDSKDTASALAHAAADNLPKHFWQDTKTSMSKVDQLQTLLNQWAGQYKEYKQACEALGEKPDTDLKPRVSADMKGQLEYVAICKDTSDYDKGFIRKLENDWSI